MTGVIKPGLERISRLLAPYPLSWRAIHVAGTNGKGTVCAYVSAMLEVYNKSKYRTFAHDSPLHHGRFTSPHLVSPLDGITVNGQPPPKDELNLWYNRIRRRSEQENIFASEFEILTATAFALFQHNHNDAKGLSVGVIEVGMGGRDDATNILGQPGQRHERARPLVTAISNIGLDHQDFLGNSLSEIARNKAGIMKPRVPVVFDTRNSPEVCDVLANEAGEERLICNQDPAVTLSVVCDGKPTLYPTANQLTERLPLHTRNNLELAFKATWTALLCLRRVRDRANWSPGFQPWPKIMDATTRDHLLELGTDMLKVHETVQVPGRLQSLDIKMLTGRQNPVLLDGAHNEQSALVLAEAVKKLRAKSPELHEGVVWVIAASQGKDIRSILKHILRPGDRILAVAFGPVEGMPWVKPQAPANILSAAQEAASLPSEQCTDLGTNVLSALQTATKIADEGPLVVAGSLYLVGDVLRLLEQKPAR